MIDYIFSAGLLCRLDGTVGRSDLRVLFDQ